MAKRSLAAALLLLCLSPVSSQAAKPAEKLDTYLNRVFQIFQDYDAARITAQESTELRQRLGRLAGEIFDYQVMARMSLARHWQDFSPEQHEEFVRIFRQLLEDNYFAKVLKYLEQIQTYSPENLAITDEIVFSERKAEVQTVISYEGKKVPVNYRFVNLQKGWRIYDIAVEGVSLVQNYRSQFDESLSSSTPEALLDGLRSKLESAGQNPS